MSKPNFFIIGTAKAGTTSAWYYLRQHPELFLAQKKECHYYCSSDMSSQRCDVENKHHAIDTAEKYSDLFAGSEESLARGEASPMYMYYPKTAERIAADVPDAKLIAILRNPADRAFSAYVHMVRDGHENLSFPDALEVENDRVGSHDSGFHPGYHYRSWGYYHQRLAPYFKHFRKDQIRLYRYEDLKNNNAASLRDMCEFLGVDPTFRFNTGVKMNVSGVPRYKWLQNYIVDGLPRSHFFNLVKRPMPESWWIRSVKFVQHWNYVKPKLADDTRKVLMDGYREDMQRLASEFQFDTSVWQNA